MKTLVMLPLVAAMAATVYSQIIPLPPSSAVDGVNVNPIGNNAGISRWDDTSKIASFKGAGLSNGNNNIITVAYNPIGLPFGTSMPASLQAKLATLNSEGGIIRTIFLADSALWRDSLGYTYSGMIAGPQSYTVFPNMVGRSTPSSPATVTFGDYFDVSLGAGKESQFDLWFQGQDAANGADYTLFHPVNSSTQIGPGNAYWAQDVLKVNTWNAALNAYVDVNTFVVGLEDWRLDRTSDIDYSDTIIALQFYTLSGTPDQPPAVPEPATYGLAGSLAILALLSTRAFKHKHSPAVTT